MVRSLVLERQSVVAIDIDGSFEVEATAGGWRARLDEGGGTVSFHLAIGGLLTATAPADAVLVAADDRFHLSSVSTLARILDSDLVSGDLL